MGGEVVHWFPGLEIQVRIKAYRGGDCVVILSKTLGTHMKLSQCLSRFTQE